MIHEGTWSVKGKYWLVRGDTGTGSVWGGTGWYLVRRGQYWLIYDSSVSVLGGTGWYLVVLGQYNLVLLGFKWNWVSTRLVCLYILKKSGDLVRCYHSGMDKQTTEQGKIELLSQWTIDG